LKLNFLRETYSVHTLNQVSIGTFFFPVEKKPLIISVTAVANGLLLQEFRKFIEESTAIPNHRDT